MKMLLLAFVIVHSIILMIQITKYILALKKVKHAYLKDIIIKIWTQKNALIL